VWGQYLGQILTGLAGLVTAFGGILLARSRQTASELAECQHDSTLRDAQQRQWRVIALRHMYQLEKLLHQTTMSVPDRPEELL
jgi:hypothetical protein